MAERDATLQQHLCTTLTQSQGWREAVLPYLLQRLTEHERLEAVPTVDTTVRLDAIARKHELVRFVQWVYKTAALPSPFEDVMLATYALTLPKAPVEPLPEPQLPPARPVRRSTGSLA